VVSATGPPWPLISVFLTGAATFHSSSSSVILTSGPRFTPTASQRSLSYIHSTLHCVTATSFHIPSSSFCRQSRNGRSAAWLCLAHKHLRLCREVTTGFGIKEAGLESLQGLRMFLHWVQPARGPTNPGIQCAPVIKRTGRETKPR
jgi:hypothetical protein